MTITTIKKDNILELPNELCISLNIKIGDILEFFIDGDKIGFKKYEHQITEDQFKSNPMLVKVEKNYDCI
jgi:bifunctional DNA-binding transcriptional regulator/antitoxin component of YhaV-PrlF toxin-antitoxin module